MQLQALLSVRQKMLQVCLALVPHLALIMLLGIVEGPVFHQFRRIFLRLQLLQIIACAVKCLDGDLFLRALELHLWLTLMVCVLVQLAMTSMLGEEVLWD